MRKAITILGIMGCVMVLATTVWAARYQFVTIGTGGVTGVYYPTGGAIAKMVNRKKKQYLIRATVESTGGSVFNVNALMSGDLEFGVVQSDRGYQAYNGLADWESVGKQTKLRSVFSIYPETVTLIVAEESGIQSCDDIRGKRIAIGNPGSGTRKNSSDALGTCGLTFDDLGAAEGLKASEGSKMLQDGRIDGYFYTVGHPNGSIKEAVAGRIKVRFVPFTNTSTLLGQHSYYANAIIPVDHYPGVTNSGNVNTFGVKATFLTSSDVDENAVYAITKEVFENFDQFTSLHPAYSALTREDLLKGLSAPLHKGALKYYREAGLL